MLDIAAAGGSALIGASMAGGLIGLIIYISHRLENRKRKKWDSENRNLTDAQRNEEWDKLEKLSKSKSQRFFRWLILGFIGLLIIIVYLGASRQ